MGSGGAGSPDHPVMLPDSLRSFVSVDDFSAVLRHTGYGRVGARSFILAGIGLLLAKTERLRASDYRFILTCPMLFGGYSAHSHAWTSVAAICNCPSPGEIQGSDRADLLI
jgi:hypothetical protein